MFEERLKGTSAIVGVAVNIMRDESFFKCVYIIVSVCVTNFVVFFVSLSSFRKRGGFQFWPLPRVLLL